MISAAHAAPPGATPPISATSRRRTTPVAERGAVPRGLRRAPPRAGMVRSFTSPLLPDDYLELVNPLWSTRELRGRIERIERETPDAVTVLIKPGWEWPGHRPGPVPAPGHRGRRHPPLARLLADLGPAAARTAASRSRRSSSRAARSRRSCSARVRPGTIVRLGGVEGTFVLPEPPPERLLFISAGSGITPIMSMLRSLAARGRAARRRARALRAHAPRA